jgi:hypothetical protein
MTSGRRTGDNKPIDYLNKNYESSQKNKSALIKKATFALTAWPLLLMLQKD